MNKFLVCMLVAAFVMFNASAYAADGDEFSTTSWRITSSGSLVPVTDSAESIGASGTEVSTIYVDTIYSKTNLTVLTATPATLTTATTGMTYVADNGTDSVSATFVAMTLPAAADGLTYNFVTGDNSQFIIRVSDANVTTIFADRIVYPSSTGLLTATNASLRNTAATAASIQLVGDSDGYWYVVEVNGTWANETKMPPITN